MVKVFQGDGAGRLQPGLERRAEVNDGAGKVEEKASTNNVDST